MSVTDYSQLIDLLNKLIFLVQSLCVSVGFLVGVTFVQFLIHVKNQRTII